MVPRLTAGFFSGSEKKEGDMMKLMILLLIILSICGLTTAAEPWREPEDFRGIKWGASEAEALRLYPSMQKVSLPSAPAGSTSYALLNAKVGDVPVMIGFTFWQGGFAQG